MIDAQSIISEATKSGHDLALPWSVKPGGNTVLDANGVPVAMSLGYTSVARRDPDGVVYHHTEAAAAIRVRLIVAAINAAGAALQERRAS